VHTRQLYFDHSRIEPRQMLVAGMKAVTTVAPGLEVDVSDPASLKLSSGSRSRVFPLRDAASFWGSGALFNEMHGYLTGSLGIPDEDRQIGFAVANGMLSTLDPGCGLISEEEYLTRKTVSEDVSLSRLLAIGPLGEDVTYLRLAGLPVGTAAVVERLLGARSRFGGLILDLRGNSEGLFQEAIWLANLFMEAPLRAEVRTGSGLMSRQMRSARTRWYGPLVILADDRTASGAEIMVAVLKDLDRGVVFGARTAGVGTMQGSMVDTDPDDGRKAHLELTIGTFKRPSGARIDGLGIVPDLAFIRTDPAGHAEEATHLGVPSHNPFAGPVGARSDSPEKSIAEVAYVWQFPADRSTPQDFLLQDLEVRLARDLLVRAPKSHRSEMLEELERLAKETRSALKRQ
jgi:hypothetical protein